MATAFIGYVLPFGQMSLWGDCFALNDLIYSLFPVLDKVRGIPALRRIGPHNKDILEFFYGSLLGKAYVENLGSGSRISLQRSESNKDYLSWTHTYLSSLGYCSTKLPVVRTRIRKGGKISYDLIIKTWTYSN